MAQPYVGRVGDSAIRQLVVGYGLRPNTPLRQFRDAGEDLNMRAEIEHLADEIKQSVGLLRRHL